MRDSDSASRFLAYVFLFCFGGFLVGIVGMMRRAPSVEHLVQPVVALVVGALVIAWPVLGRRLSGQQIGLVLLGGVGVGVHTVPADSPIVAGVYLCAGIAGVLLVLDSRSSH